MSAPETPAPASRRDPDAGDTLIEILISVAILGIVSVALLGGFLTSISTSSDYHAIANADTVLRTAVDAVTTQLQQNPAAAFDCPAESLTTPPSVYLVSGLPSGYSSQVTQLNYWVNGTAQSTCTVDAPQLITLTVTYTNAAGRKTSTNRATFLVDDPQAAPVPTYGNATQLVFLPTGGPSNTTAGSAIPQQPLVAVEDAQGHIVTTDLSPVSLSITSGTGTPGAQLANCTGTEFYGVVNFSGCEIDTAGSGYTLTATDPGLLNPTATSSPAVAPFTVNPGPPTHLVFTQSPGPAPPQAAGTDGTAFTQQPTVTVFDAYGNVATQDSSTVTLAITSGTGTAGANFSCSPSNSLAATAGVAPFTGCLIDTPGSGYTLTATDGSLTSATSTAFTIAPGSPDHLVFTTQPVATAGAQAGTGGIAFTQQPVVTIKDAKGYTVTSNTSTVTLLITSNTGPTGASLTCSPSSDQQAASAGVATFSGCAINEATQTSSDYTLTATDGTITAATSWAFSIGVGPAAQVAFSTEPVVTAGAQAGTAGSAFTQQPVVSIEDAGGNTVTSNTSTVTLSITSGTGTSGASLTCSPSSDKQTASAGVATFSGCSINKAGSGYTLSATDGTLTSATSFAFSIAPGPATQIVFTTEPGGSITAGTAFPTQPVVTIEDAEGDTVTTGAGSNSAVTLSIASGNGTITCSSNPVTASSGVASFSGCAINKTGSHTLTATDGSLTATSSSFTVNPGPATQLAFTTSPGGGITGQAFPTQPVVTIEDAEGNTVTTNTSTVTLAINSGTGTLSGCSGTTSGGVATFSGCKITASDGSFTLKATDGTLTSAISSSFTITGAATKLVFTTQPGGATKNQAFTQQPVVTIEDASGNTVTTNTSSVTLTISSGSGTLTCTTNPLAATSGVATFSGCSINASGTFKLKATDGTLTSATSSSFTVS